MLNLLTEAETTACPPAARGVLVQYLAGEISPEIALMHLLLAAGAMGPLRDCLERLRATGREPLVRLAQLAIEHRDGLQHAASLVEAGLTEARGDDRLAAIREQYDRAVATAPEAAVALYSLGDPTVLDRATAELAALLEEWGLVGADREALDIGCGIGRMERALGPRLRHITGIDLSPAMVAEAKRRCAGIANVTFDVTGGRGLSQFAQRRFDLILAIDSFPCIVAASPEIARQHIHDAARLLRPGGSFAIFNYSYRGDIAADRVDVATHAKAAGLVVLRNGTRDLALWDGTSFLLKAVS
jgi:SAM-dependent methyltransferase